MNPSATTGKTVTASPVRGGKYLLGEAVDLTREQLGYFSELFDQPTRAFVESLGIRSGARCLEVGAGNGSVSDWLADHVAAGEEVLAVDLDSTHLVDHPGVIGLRHDITAEAPPGGPFDLIFARAVLMHLPEREAVLARLADALAPGGWLVLSDCSSWGTDPDEVLAMPTASDRELYTRVARRVIAACEAGGVDYSWARRTDAEMQRAGLESLQGMEYLVTMTGGSTAALLNRNYYRQIREPMLACGAATAEELDRFDVLMADPQFRARFFRLTFTAGRKQG